MFAERESQCKRNLDHLKPNESLFDYMKSLLNYNIKSSHPCINTYMLNRQGVPKGSNMKISYEDAIIKREFLNDLLMNTIMPAFWFNNLSLKESQDASSTKAVMIDIKGNFSLRRMIDHIRNYYESLVNKAAREHGVLLFNQKQYDSKDVDMIAGVEGAPKYISDFDNSNEEIKEQDYKEDKANFIRSCFKNLYYFSVMTPEEFAAVANSLNKLIKDDKDIILVCVDGLHHFDLKSCRDEDERLDEDFEENVPDASNFFSQEDTDHFVKFKSQPRMGGKKFTNSKYYERNLVSKALDLITFWNRQQLYTLIKLESVGSFKKSDNLLSEISKNGLSESCDFYVQDNNNVRRFQGNIDTEDEAITKKLKTMKYNEILILRGDRTNSLNPDTRLDTAEVVDTRHCAGFLRLFPKKMQDLKKDEVRFQKFMSLFLLYEHHDQHYKISDNCVRVFAF